MALINGTAASGITFSRQSSTELTVVAPTGRLTGTVQDTGVDDNGDGLLDRVAVDVQTNATRAGTYRAFVHHKTVHGQNLVRSAEVNLAPGIQSIRVNFEANAFLQLGENGPYNMQLIELVFLETTEAIPSDRLPDVGQTRAYLLSQFQRPAVTLTGVTSDQAVDDNGNGRFDRLLVSVQVNVLRSGFYSWGYKLTDQSAREIDFASNTSFFNAGVNNLNVTFNGTKIGAFGANGPYQLRDLLLQGPATSLVVIDVGHTQLYQFTQFEGAILNRPPIADAGPDQTVECRGAQTTVQLNGTGSTDPDNDTLSYEWFEGSSSLGTGSTLSVTLALGAHNITLIVADPLGSSSSDTVKIDVVDTTPPSIGNVIATPDSLWPPNHKMTDITVSYIVTDNCCAVSTALRITSDEPIEGTGDGDTGPDWEIVDEHHVRLRGERAGDGSGRVYTIILLATDCVGNSSSKTVTVNVPKSQGNLLPK